MDAASWGLVATVGYVLAAAFAVVSVILFFTLHIRNVRDDLTGRTAQRALADLREGRGSRSRFFGGDERGVAVRGGAKGSADAEGSGSLKLRRFSSKEETLGDTGATGAVAEDTQGTTMLGNDKTTNSLAGAEGSTTLIGPTGGDDVGTTMLGTSGNDNEGEAGTTLLGEQKEAGR